MRSTLTLFLIKQQFMRVEQPIAQVPCMGT